MAEAQGESMVNGAAPEEVAADAGGRATNEEGANKRSDPTSAVENASIKMEAGDSSGDQTRSDEAVLEASENLEKRESEVENSEETPTALSKDTKVREDRCSGNLGETKETTEEQKEVGADEDKSESKEKTSGQATPRDGVPPEKDLPENLPEGKEEEQKPRPQAVSKSSKRKLDPKSEYQEESRPKEKKSTSAEAAGKSEAGSGATVKEKDRRRGSGRRGSEETRADAGSGGGESRDRVVKEQDCQFRDEDSRLEGSEVGIVGPPTAVRDLVSEEELRTESDLPTEGKAQLQDHVAEWVQNSVKPEGELERLEDDEEGVESRGEVADGSLGKPRKGSEPVGAALASRKSQRVVVSNIIKKSIKCLNKMHAMDNVVGNGKRVEATEKKEEPTQISPKIPQSQQNGAALPEETAAAAATDHVRPTTVKKEPFSEHEDDQKPSFRFSGETDAAPTRKRRSPEETSSTNGKPASKRVCFEQREQFISSLVGCDKVTAEELAARAEQLRIEVQALDELARAKEMEWNEILSMRKLKEEAYLRIERKRQVVGFMEGNGQLAETLPPSSMTLAAEWEAGNTAGNKERCDYGSQGSQEDGSHDDSPLKKEKSSKGQSHRRTSSPKQCENGRKQVMDPQNLENRPIGEGRQGPIVDVRSIIADYRLRHPETVPRRMRNSVNVGLGAGGAMVETGHTVDSRPSSTDSCKSNSNATDPNNSMSFKDVLVQFAKLSQQQGEPLKTPQNYPDVTLHPVAPSPVPQSPAPQQTGSLLHGILTKSQSPRPATFSPTLARLLTAPERERNAPVTASAPQQNTTQHLLQAYQGSNPVSISDLLSSSKARTEITITPVVNTPVQSHSNNLIHVFVQDDVEEETSVIEERDTRISSGSRDGREGRESPPRCQGCHERAAQFVCAGCGNQWYCSRECQVSAWDEHSEVCSG
ncbi:uncharacterized protein LOC105698245 isoform X3 [Orussus abietinus]|uniref:uncharacterized protein LOC105698245 isoform X3 n=1 Tax=Orussus abietinus TaxID=222816 RepID=UPI000626776B|nr:uncharacterized protein LOC105698245 isoform X3 [Orussus abietinus]